ncbi:hypothetical protein ACPV5O_15440 [Vibrio maritimus]|uniref:Uncharacterized protein n=2 Tax=Vibrio TaxID=662 RepID=A0A090RQT1_9VIBR|nr:MULTISPECIES: hypothetical protein [Vibrio]USD63468.1 hypothetical protein J4N45_21035 [Vibrio sp. SCSIO 43140]GAL17780.1 hypothetical protein JCM19235_6333 [Vibrio maritimus]GAL26131.1 hypothetical protein JCM19239_4986 [Vibrio variabilis]
MNSALLSTLDTEKSNAEENNEKASVSSTSTAAEIATILAMFLATSAVILLLSLTWVM